MEKSTRDSLSTETSEEKELIEAPGVKKKKTSIISWGITGLILLATVGVIIFAGMKETDEPIPTKKKLTNVEVLTIETKEFIESLTLPAIIKADRVARIKPEFTGILERWFFPEGAQVNMGDVIAEIDTKTLRLNLEELEAALKTASQNVTLSNIRKESAQVNLTTIRKNTRIEEIALESAESNLKLAKKQFVRVQEMAKKKIASVSQLDDAQNALTQAELAVIRARQNLNSAQLKIRSAELAIKETNAGIDLAEAKIVELEASIALLEYRIEKGMLRAPFSGRLEEHLVQPGEMVSPAAPIVSIYDLKYLRATINVPDRYVAFLDPKNAGTKEFIRLNMPGTEQRIKAKVIVPGLPKLTGGIESGIELDAQIARIAQSSDPESNTFKVELRLPNPGNSLKHGIIARSRIEYLFYPTAIIIPVKAVQVTDAGPRVLVVEEISGEQIVNSRDIKPVSIHGSNVFVRGGIKTGDRLIVAGWKGLVGGEAVNVLVEDGKFIKSGKENPGEI